MKKIISVITAAALALSLCCCDKADDSSENNSEIGGESAADNIPCSFDEFVQLGGYQPCLTENGMYYIDDSSYSDKDFAHIMYIDFATKQETYLCSDSSCNHRNERCTSCIVDTELFGMNTSLFVYNGYLFLLNLYRTSEGSFGTHGVSGGGSDKQALYRMNLDGTNRELIYTFDKNLSVDSTAVGDGDDLWFCVHEEYVEKSRIKDMYYVAAKNKAMIRLSLSQLIIVEQIPIKDADVGYCICVGKKFILSGIQYPDGMTKMEFSEKCYELSTESEGFAPTDEVIELQNKCRYVYYTLDPVNKETKLLYRTETSDRILPFAYNGELCIPLKNDEARDINVKINVVTGETEDFTAAEGCIITGGVFAEKYVCNRVENGGSVTCYVDAKTGDISECRLNIEPLGLIPIEPITVFDGKAFVHHSDYYLGKSGNGYLECYPEYAFISLDDLFNSRPDYEPVKMIEKGEAI